jgi:hypothetical protein
MVNPQGECHMVIPMVPGIPEHRDHPPAPPRRWIGRIRRARYFSPLALILALILSAASWAPLASIGLVPRAQAVTPIDIVTCDPDKLHILGLCDENGSPLAEQATLGKFETDIIDALMDLYRIAPEDRPLVLKYARTPVRGAMVTKLLAIAQTKAADRTDEEKILYNWFQARVWTNEKKRIDSAIAEYNRWFFDACDYTLDPDIAAALKLSYSGAPFCHPDPFSLGPDAPDKSYFLAIGFQEAYNKPIANQPGGPAITAGTVRAIALFASAPVIAVAVVAAITIGAPILVASGVAAAVFPFAAAAGAAVAALAVAGVVFFVLLAVVIGIIAAIKVFSPTALDEMNAERTAVYAAPPDLSTYTDASGLLKITQTLIQATLPEFTSTDALPTHRDQDGLFIVQPKDGTSSPHLTMTYEDWDGEIRTATLDHGFFLVEHTKDDGTVEKEMTLSIQYVDWNDRQWTGWRRGDTFVSVKGESSPAFTDADTVSSTVDLLDGAGAKVRVSIGHPPAFTSASSAGFSIGAANSFTITTSGSTPAITLEAGSTPTGVTFADQHDGTAKLSGTPAAGSAGQYTLMLLAKNAAGEDRQTFTLNAGTAPVFSSIPPLVFREGLQKTVTIVATGAPPPAIRLDRGQSCDFNTSQCTPSGGPFLPDGLAFTDLGNGTATISGTAAAGTGSSGVSIIVHQFLTATNISGTTTQDGVVVQVRPPLTIASPASTVFGVGVSNSFTVQTTGAPQKITVDGSPPANVTFTDNGNGTATFAGTPPFSARGTYPLTLTATADDTSTTQSFTLEVQPKVTALGPATAWIGINNSDDVGLRVDLLAEVFLKAGTTVAKIGDGELDNQTTGSSGFNNAGLKSIPIGLIGDAAVVRPGSELQYKLSVRRTCAPAGHATGTVAFWYNGRAVDSGSTRDAGSRVAATVGGVAGAFFVHPGLELSDTAATARTSINVPLTSAQPCPGRAFTPVGTWAGALP